MLSNMVMDIGFFVALSLHCYLNTNIVIQNMHTYCSISLSNSMQFYPKIDEALRLLNNRFINYVGGIGNNVPLDLHMEHLNLMLKQLTKNSGGHLTERTMQRNARSLYTISTIMKAVHEDCGKKQPLGWWRRSKILCLNNC